MSLLPLLERYLCLLLVGRSAIITGASRGLGKAIAAACLANGCDLTICSSSADQLQSARAELLAAGGSAARVNAVQADVSDEKAVNRLVASAIQHFGKVDILVNNAGVLGPIGLCEALDWQDWLRTIEVNLFGPVLLCRAAMPHFKAQRYGRIVNLSGGGATDARPRFSAYAASKAALVRFSETLAEEVKEFGITVNAMAPGALNTNMLEEVLAAGPEQAGEKAFAAALAQKDIGGADFDLATNLCVFLASESSASITGKLISAVWDPWPRLAAYEEKLSTSDIYTLRRITPGDRGLNWE